MYRQLGRLHCTPCNASVLSQGNVLYVSGLIRISYGVRGDVMVNTNGGNLYTLGLGSVTQ